MPNFDPRGRAARQGGLRISSSSRRDGLKDVFGEKEWDTVEEVAPQRVPKEELENEERELNAEPERAVRAGRRLYEKTKEAVGPSFEQSEPDDPRETENKPYPSQNHAVRDLRRAFKEPDIRASVEKKSRLAPVFTDAPGDGSLGEGLRAWGDTARIEKARFAPPPAPPVMRGGTVRAPATHGNQNAVEPPRAPSDFSDMAAVKIRERIERNRARIADLSSDPSALQSLDAIRDGAALEQIEGAERRAYDAMLREAAHDPAKRQRFFQDREVAEDVASKSGDPLAAQKYLTAGSIGRLLAEKAKRLIGRTEAPLESGSSIAPIPDFEDLAHEVSTAPSKPEERKPVTWNGLTFPNVDVATEAEVAEAERRRREKYKRTFNVPESRWPNIFHAESELLIPGTHNELHYAGEGERGRRQRRSRMMRWFTSPSRAYAGPSENQPHEHPPASTLEGGNPSRGRVWMIPKKVNNSHGGALGGFFGALVRAGELRAGDPFYYRLELNRENPHK